MQRLIMGPEVKKYKTVLVESKQSQKGITGYQWILRTTEYVTMEKLWTCMQLDGVDGSGYIYLGAYRCLNFQKEFWLDLGKIMWKKHRSVFQDHVKYIHSDIVKPFRVVILQYTERVREMHDLEKYLPPTSMKRREFESDDWDVHER